MWDNVDRIIQRLESQIDFNLKTTDLYDSQYCSKEDEDCSIQSSNFIRELVQLKTHNRTVLGLNKTVYPLMKVSLS